MFESKEGGKYEGFQDHKVRWEAIKRSVAEAFQEASPYTVKDVSLEISNIVVKDKDFSKAEQKQYIMSRRDMTVPVMATVAIKDAVTGKLLDKETNKRIMNLPKYTERFTFIMGGNEYTTMNQYRVRAGVYTRFNAIGNVESQFNTGSGRGFKINMDPKTGIFYMTIQNANISLYGFLKQMGVPVSSIVSAWGKDLVDINATKDDPKALRKVWDQFFARFKEWPGEVEAKDALLTYFSTKSTFESQVTQSTLGKPYSHLTMEAILDATKKMLKVNKLEEEPDDRDSLKYKKILSIDDFIKERIVKDMGELRRRLLFKLNSKKSIKEVMPTSYFSKYVKDFVVQSSLSSPAAQTNIVEVLEGPTSVTVMGEGGIQSTTSIPDEARNIHPTHVGLLDTIRTPESIKVGVTSRFGVRAYKGPNQYVYTEVRDVKTGKTKMVSAAEMSDSNIAFPGEMSKPGNMAIVISSNNKQLSIPKSKVDYEILDGASMYGMTSNMVPLFNTSSPNRLQMAGKMAGQALPLKDREEAFVQSQGTTNGKSINQEIGEYVAPKAPEDGVVVSATGDTIIFKGESGTKHSIDLYNNFPFNQKTMLHNDVLVKPGMRLKKGDLLAESNYTKNGTLALGRNLNVAYMNYNGLTFEDGMVISEAASKKLTSEHVYQETIEVSDGVEINRPKFVSMYPSVVKSSNLAKLDQDGVVKPGSVIEPGEVVIMALQKKTPSASDLALGKLSKGLLKMYTDASIEWTHDNPAEVLEVFKGPRHIKVTIKTHEPVKVGDKLSGSFGNKGVVSYVVPDDQMPRTKDGPLDMFMSPEGLVSRMNPGQIHETMLGKVAKKTGKPYVLKPFAGDTYQFVKDEMKKHDVSKWDPVHDPASGRDLGNIMNGYQHIFKLSKTTESAVSGRGGEGSYTINKQPAKGGFDGAKTNSIWDSWALLGHNAKNLLQEAATYKGERNDTFWNAVREGRPIPKPQTPFVWNKFLGKANQMGVDIQKDGDSVKMLPLTDKDVEAMSAGEVKNVNMVRTKDFSPETGGLFDYTIFGGLNGDRYGHIDLKQKLPNPMFEDPIRVLLDLTKQEFLDVMSSKRMLNGKTGVVALETALKRITVSSGITDLEREVRTSRGLKRDRAVKKLKYLMGLQRMNKTTADYFVSKVPVIPPEFRPLIPSSGGSILVSPANYLYKDVMQSNEAYQDLKDDLPEEEIGGLRSTLYQSVKALQGMADPISPEAKTRNVRGALAEIAGSIPKHGFFQSVLLRKPQDIAGRGVAVPMPNLKMDQLGLPEKIAYQIYKPFIEKRMISAKVPRTEIGGKIEARDPMARSSLLAEMAVRPVLVNRAPILHKFNLMAFWPVLVTGSSIGFPSVVVGGFSLDYDGDQVNVTIPVTQAGVQDAMKMFPSKNLNALNQHGGLNYKPTLGALLGLQEATRRVGDKSVASFANKKEADAAFNAGTIDYGTPIMVKKSQIDSDNYNYLPEDCYEPPSF